MVSSDTSNVGKGMTWVVMCAAISTFVVGQYNIGTTTYEYNDFDPACSYLAHYQEVEEGQCVTVNFEDGDWPEQYIFECASNSATSPFNIYLCGSTEV